MICGGAGRRRCSRSGRSGWGRGGWPSGRGRRWRAEGWRPAELRTRRRVRAGAHGGPGPTRPHRPPGARVRPRFPEVRSEAWIRERGVAQAAPGEGSWKTSSPSTPSSVSIRRSASASVKTSDGLISGTSWHGPSVESRIPWSRMRSAAHAACSSAGLAGASSDPPRPRTQARPRCPRGKWSGRRTRPGARLPEAQVVRYANGSPYRPTDLERTVGAVSRGTRPCPAPSVCHRCRRVSAIGALSRSWSSPVMTMTHGPAGRGSRTVAQSVAVDRAATLWARRW